MSTQTQPNITDEKDFQYYGRKKQTPISLETLLETGRGTRLKEFENMFSSSKHPDQSDRIRIQIACFLHRELPVRLAHRVLELGSIDVFQDSPSIRSVRNWYKTSFAQLRNTPVPMDNEKEAHFARVIESIYERHSATLITMAKGAHEIRTILKQDSTTFAESSDIQKRLDDFYMSRIGIRMVSLFIIIRVSESSYNNSFTTKMSSVDRTVSRTSEIRQRQLYS